MRLREPEWSGLGPTGPGADRARLGHRKCLEAGIRYERAGGPRDRADLLVLLRRQMALWLPPIPWGPVEAEERGAPCRQQAQDTTGSPHSSPEMLSGATQCTHRLTPHRLAAPLLAGHPQGLSLCDREAFPAVCVCAAPRRHPRRRLSGLMALLILGYESEVLRVKSI